MKIYSALILFLTLFSGFVFAASSEDLRRAVDLNKSGIQKTKDKNLDGAENDFLQALIYSGEEPQIRKNLGVVYYEKGVNALKVRNDYREGRRYLGKALEVEPQNEKYRKAYASALFLGANTLVKQGNAEEALKFYEEATSFDEKNITAWVQAAHYAWVTQRLDLARKYFARAKSIDPDDKNVRIMEERLSGAILEKDLQTQSSEHFILSADADYLKNAGSHNVLYDLEEAFNSVSYKLSFYPKNKIPVVFYPLNDFREHWRMPGRVNAFYDGKLRIPYLSDKAPTSVFKPVIMHELTHAFIGFMIDRPIPQWLNEGLAQWVEGKTIDRRTKDLMMNYEVARRAPDIAHLDNVLKQQKNSFNNNEMTLAYMKSFSFVEYLIETHGIWTVMQMIKDIGRGEISEDVFKKNFHADLKDLERSWVLWFSKK